jgi:hypothetical protein
MLATRMAATGTSASGVPSARRRRITARSLRQNRRSHALERDRVDVPGVAAQVADVFHGAVVGAWKRWYMLDVSRSVT